MATKGDLIQAQGFSRRRLLTAFVSGAPGGKELEPAKPLRAVIAAVALAVALIAVGVFWGLFQPGLPQGWDNGRLILARDTGARYVSVKGVVHPVANTVSARLMIPAKEFAVISTDQASLKGVELGSTLGIAGAPDTLPAPSALADSGWTACVAGGDALAVRIGPDPAATASPAAAVVRSDGRLYVVSGHTRFAVASDDTDAVLRAAGITALSPQPAPAAWTNLFAAGAALGPLNVPAATPVGGTTLRTGEVVHITGTADGERFLITPDGQLAPLSPLAWQLYQLGDGPSVHAPTEVTAAAVRGLPTSRTPAGGADWPEKGFTEMPEGQRPCALLAKDGTATRTVLATQPTTADATAGVRVTPGSGALVYAGAGADSARMLTLVDATGTAYALPGATADTVARLGYTTKDVGRVDAAWTSLLPAGPALTTAAAGKTPQR